MAPGEPGISAPLSKRAKIIISTLIVFLVIALCGVMFHIQTESSGPYSGPYRIQWNPAIPKAIVEQYGVEKTDGLGWYELKEFRSLNEANEFLDRHLSAREAVKKINAQWRTVREEN